MQKRILCYGDSNTWGAVPEESSRYPEDVRWTGVLQNELGEGYRVVEEGFNGRTTVHDDPVEGRISGIRYFGACLDSQSPLDLVIIMLGTNDLKKRFGVNPKTVAYGLQRYLDIIATAPIVGNKPQVLVVAPILIDPSYKNHALFHDMFGEDAVERSEGFAAAYKEFADTARVAFLNAAEYGKASVKDGVHMEPDSHERLGKALAEKVRELLG